MTDLAEVVDLRHCADRSRAEFAAIHAGVRANFNIVAEFNMPDMRERLSNQGAEPVGNTPDESAAQLRADIAKWAKVIKATGAAMNTVMK